MNHSSDENRVGSPGTGDAGSGGGAPLSPTFHCAVTVTRCPLTSHRNPHRNLARPGITPGKRTLTRTSYGPALPVKKLSGLPTWAETEATEATESAETESTEITEKNL